MSERPADPARRVVLLMPTRTYRASDFLAAAAGIGVEVVVGTEKKQALEKSAPGRFLELDFRDPEEAARRIARLADERPVAAILATDDETTLPAAMASETLGLPHNPPEAVRASSDKRLFRERLRQAGFTRPWFAVVPMDGDPRAEPAGIEYPCVLKPRRLSGSRGVIRANGPGELIAARDRIAAILREPEAAARSGDAVGEILAEEYVDGFEVAVEGLLERGSLEVLALFDKPDPLVGPTFEETIYVTPSRLAPEVCARIERVTEDAARAIGLTTGPVHAELRVTAEGEAVPIEVAARTIGGLCGRILRFGAGASLEEVVLRHALGQGVPAVPGASGAHDAIGASGVMMIPIPRGGILRDVLGREEALAVAGIEDVVVTVSRGERVVPLPEGNRYLGFVFARGNAPAGVEEALRQAHARLAFVIDEGMMGGCEDA